MAIWGAQTVRIDEFEYARERERAAELDVVRGGGIDARVRQGVSHRFVTIASYVMATVALLVALGVCRVALTTVTVSQLRSNVSLRSSIETAQKVNADLRIERSVLSSSSRICRIAEQNYGMESKSGESSLNPVGLGSGIIMDSSGHIITNYHVIKDAEQIIVAIQDGRIFTAKLIGVDLLTDLAVVKIDAENLPVIPTNDDLTPRVGDVVLAIGNPFNVGQTVTQGIISATGRSGLGTMGPNTRGRQDLLQSDVSINSGNSGGALVNTRGELVGIASGQYQRGSASGESDSTGISFAIPYKLAKRIMGELIKNGKVTRGYLGISTVDIDPISAELFNISGNEGLIIRDVEPSGRSSKLR